MKVILYTQNEMVNVVYPSPSFLENHTMTEVAQCSLPNGVDYMIVEDNFMPSDQEFRDAWVFNGKNIHINITKAKAITKDRIRRQRKSLLEALDVESIKNLLNPDQLLIIEQKKQKLRDRPQLVDSLSTVDELKAFSVE